MTIPNETKDTILFTFKRRGIIPVHVGAGLIVFDVQFVSGLYLSAATTFSTKPVIALGVLVPKEYGGAQYTEYMDGPTDSADIVFGIKCASKLLAMVRSVADELDAGACVSEGWLGQSPKS